jgi:hypothetical protein
MGLVAICFQVGDNELDANSALTWGPGQWHPSSINIGLEVPLI